MNTEEIMRYPCFLAACLLVLSTMPACAQASKPNLSGTWRLNPAKSEIHSPGPSSMTIEIDQKGNSLHVTTTIKGSDGKQTKSEFQCTTDGKECDAGGMKVSLWYNGAVLVQMDAGSDAVSKNSMKLGDDKKSMEVEIEHIVPPAEADKLVLEKF